MAVVMVSWGKARPARTVQDSGAREIEAHPLKNMQRSCSGVRSTPANRPKIKIRNSTSSTPSGVQQPGGGARGSLVRPVDIQSGIGIGWPAVQELDRKPMRRLHFQAKRVSKLRILGGLDSRFNPAFLVSLDFVRLDFSARIALSGAFSGRRGVQFISCGRVQTSRSIGVSSSSNGVRILPFLGAPPGKANKRQD